MSNGIHHPPQPSGPHPNGTPNSVPFPGNAPQPNGIPGPSTGLPGPPPGQNPPQFMPNQRPGPPPQRGANGVPFPSPTMANSPPHNPGAPQPNMGGGVGTNTPLTQMNNRTGMLPPAGPQGPMGNPQHTPQQGFQPLGRSPSGPASPASNLTGQSPSMPPRPPPGAPGMMPNTQSQLDMEINRIPPQMLMRVKVDLGIGEKDMGQMTIEDKVRACGA